MLGHPWHNPDPRVDELQQHVQAWISDAEGRGLSRTEIFRGILEQASETAGIALSTTDPVDGGDSIPRLSENWYCCAEPTCEQLNTF
jgi:hypothetical protein